ncbi:class I SAM-dependent methyltransferase [Kistimonas asteriae]|uniref:class I SAM-dependent methyltransferase n=1 Tax=Kistimonas asteriae TaxID=517724 RepID=UPI001BAE42F4
MKQETRPASLSPAQAYQTILVPALFTEWAPRVADAAGIQAGQRVLDVACSTGVLTREIHHRAGPTGHVTGMDLNPDMLAVASTLIHAIEWKKGDAEDLPFPDDHFDAAVCHFALMFFNDKVKALSEMLRVIKPGGKIAVIVWDALNNVPAYAKVTELLKADIGEDAADALRKPFCLGGYDQLVPLFEQAAPTIWPLANRSGMPAFLISTP